MTWSVKVRRKEKFTQKSNYICWNKKLPEVLSEPTAKWPNEQILTCAFQNNAKWICSQAKQMSNTGFKWERRNLKVLLNQMMLCTVQEKLKTYSLFRWTHRAKQQQQLLTVLVWLYFPFHGWPGTGPCIPLWGHCVLNPRGTIIPDRRPLSLGNRGRGNRSCTLQSTSADDSEDTTDHRKSLCMWGAAVCPRSCYLGLWLGLAASKVIQEPPKIRYRRHPRTSTHSLIQN